MLARRWRNSELPVSCFRRRPRTIVVRAGVWIIGPSSTRQRSWSVALPSDSGTGAVRRRGHSGGGAERCLRCARGGSPIGLGRLEVQAMMD